MKHVVFSVAVLGLGLASCSGSAGTTSSPSQRAPQAVFERKLQAAMKAHQPKLSPTAKAYVMDSIGIQDGSQVAAFPASATLTRDASGLTVFDPSSGQTFRFSVNAAVHSVPGGGRVYVEPGETLPAWARAANARPVSPGKQ